MATRTTGYRLTMSVEEQQRLHELAHAAGVKASVYLRDLLDREWRKHLKTRRNELIEIALSECPDGSVSDLVEVLKRKAG